ncbi:S8 family serine peptidase [Streptomyces sp. DG2A-72]|uniref:S8 family peptidase n=1 Tax=Streptomyces sp. DG2A-72 TaxID=3051386 RepID=UPI00265C47A7|nr:S8 family serine peptidase [Streptomyces sp. DG2A-72]MDO0934915.1 S8 family serine peptidase [Streptomyces sp. DG2A-72]
MRRAALTGSLLLSVLALGAAPTAAAPAGATSPTAGSASGGAQRVIVLLRDQHPHLSPRTETAQRDRAVSGDQKPILSLLRKNGAGHVTRMSLLNAVAATLKPSAIARIRADRQVAAVVPDLPLPQPPDRGPAGTTATGATGSPSGTTATACPKDPKHPVIEPEALSLTKTDTAHKLATGKGVKVAFMADGIDVNNPEFVRPDGSHVITDYQDFTGAGTDDHTDGLEAFGDASSVAAQGSRTYDLAQQLPYGKAPKGCTVRMRGFAPDAELMSLKVFGEDTPDYTSGFVQAVQYAVEHHADVISQSFGINSYPDPATDPLRLADQAAVAAGTTVVASTGDSGVSGTIGSPASDPQVIGVGATTALRVTAEGHGYRGWTSDNIAALSSGGTTPGNKLVDLVAPGMEGMAACTPGPHWTGCTLPTQVFGGTSQSAPFVAGAAADVIQAYESTHGGARPAPGLVKRVLTGTATDLGTPADEQGAGLLNTDAAVRAARTVGTIGGRADSTSLIPSAGQLDITGQPGATRHTTVTLTNTANRPQKVTMTSRTTGSTTFRADRTVTVGKPLGNTAHGRLAIKPFTVQVPKNTPFLDLTMAWPGKDKSGHLIPVLFDPKGRLTQVGYDYGGGGHSNHQYVDVRNPAPGDWTVKVVWGVGYEGMQYPVMKPGSYRGPLHIQVTGHRWTSAGVPGQTRTVPSGGTAVFPVTVPVPRTAGDAPLSLQFASDAGARLSLPVARRTLIPVDPARGHSTSFTARLTGGVGRDVGQTNGYYLDVPKGRRNLTVDLTAQEAGTEVVSYLISPQQQILARDSNRTGVKGTTPAKYASLTVDRPAAGRWTLIVAVPDAVSGKEIGEQVTGRVRLDAVTATASGLPNSPARVIKRGSKLKVTVRVPNPGPAKRYYFLDPRLAASADVSLPEIDGKATVPVNGTQAPQWWVPTHTTALRATVTADVPVDASLVPWSGAPEVLGAPGLGGASVATAAADQLAAGLWSVHVSQPGPYTGSAAPKGTAKVTVTATTQPVDPGAQASTGRFWDFSAEDLSLPVAAGKTGTMTLTLAPTAAVGTVVHGIVYVDTDSALGVANGSELIGIPYTYTVG